MLSTELIAGVSLIVAVLSAICAFLSTRVAIAARQHVDSVAEWVAKTGPTAVTQKQMAQAQIALADHADALDEMYKGLKSLRSRVGMRELREKRKVEESDLPDANTDPEGWKKYMRQRLHMEKLNGK